MTLTEAPSRIPQHVTPKAENVSWGRQPADMAAMAEQLLNKLFAGWFEDVKTTEANFKAYVYDNQEMGDLDLRQHRLWLHNLLGSGEALIVNFHVFRSMTGDQNAFQDQMSLVEQKVKELFATLIAWHGPIEAQTDFPESLKQAMREAEAGDLEDGGMV